jgi:PIN domain nuclease of toxin-antitoxin system
MPLHRITSITIGVPNLAPTAAYYERFGLTPTAEGRFATADGGEQLRLVTTPRRRLVELGIGVDDPDDLDRIAAALSRLGVGFERMGASVVAADPGTQTRVVVRIAERIQQPAAARVACNAPGRPERADHRADGILRDGPVRPRKLGHVVLGSTDLDASQRFFIAGIGFKVSDTVAGLASFLRCSTDHHNLLVQPASRWSCGPSGEAASAPAVSTSISWATPTSPPARSCRFGVRELAPAWEIAIKVGIGKLKWSNAALSIDASIAASGFMELPVSARHAAAVRDLPPHHGDPFDRLLIAQALAEGVRIVTADGVFGRYGVPTVSAGA